MSIPFDNTYAKLPERFFAKQAAAAVPNPSLIRVNRSLAESLGIDPDWLTSEQGLAVLSGNAVAEGAEPLAQAYAGHQFGGFVPQLGDGRALLLGEVVARSGARYDIQLKGSGRTPFSRNGDGKSALGPVIREYVVSEAMAALGVPTTRALAAVATGEVVFRQEGMVLGGVFTRVASSHLRVGTFQYFSARGDTEALRLLADYAIERHYPQAAAAEEPYLALLKSVALAQADLIAHWMSLGFIHGVMNTDNCAISGETIDYGPCAFVDAFHPNCVFSSIDSRGRYAWGNQPNIGIWNMARFAECLLPLLDAEAERATEKANEALSAYPERFREQYQARFSAKLGLPPEGCLELVGESLNLLSEQEIDFTLFFRELTRIGSGNTESSLVGLFVDQAPFGTWLAKWREAFAREGNLEAMRRANPIRIPRNHRVEQVIQSAYRGDYAPFDRLLAALAEPFEERPEFAEYEAPPRPDEVVERTFCGT